MGSSLCQIISRRDAEVFKQVGKANIVGQFVGTVALAAVGGSAAQVVNLIVGFFTGISTGASVVITHHYGAEDEKGIFNATHTAYAIALAGGLVLSLIGIFATPFLIHMMNTPEEVVPEETSEKK